MKRGSYISFVIIVIILVVAVLGYTGLLTKMTGYASSSTTALNITVGNNAPTIPVVNSISATNPTDDTTTSITFNFTATDTDGAANLNPATAQGYFQRSGETTRSNTSCSEWATSGNNANYTCTILMWYYDQNGAWTVNVTIEDDSGSYVTNSSTTFTYNILPGMKMAPTSLAWTGVTAASSDVGSNNDPIQVNNTGNDAAINLNVTSYNLRGEQTTTEFIYAENFTIENASQGCTGTAMVNATSTNVTSSILERGNHSLNYDNATSGQEQLYFCLKGIPTGISQQSYSSSAYGSWTVEII